MSNIAAYEAALDRLMRDLEKAQSIIHNTLKTLEQLEAQAAEAMTVNVEEDDVPF